MTRHQKARLEVELVALVRGYGIAVDYQRRVACGKKSDGQTRYCAPDLTAFDQRVVAFFDGCYWHRCPEHGPDDAEAVVIREKDARINAGLAADGWLVVRVWEHDDFKQSAARIVDAICERHASKKAIHRLDPPLRHRGGDWCEHCTDEPHAAVPDDRGRFCRRCDESLEGHDERVLGEILRRADILADDIKIVALRHGDDRYVSRSEMLELAAIAKRFSRQVEFLSGDNPT